LNTGRSLDDYLLVDVVDMVLDVPYDVLPEQRIDKSAGGLPLDFRADEAYEISDDEII
jgi:hypothetical protein